MSDHHKTPGQIAYEDDVRQYPLYHDGKPRAAWENLGLWIKHCWEVRANDRPARTLQ